MKRRYVVKAVFKDPDFGEITDDKSFWFQTSAVNHWYNLEKVRLSNNESRWHWVVYDKKTGQLIKS